MTREPDLEMPWGPLPTSVYADDGPTEAMNLTVDGVEFWVSPLAEYGIHTGRTRYRVECMTCVRRWHLHNAVIHPATTGPRARVVDHIRLHKESP